MTPTEKIAALLNAETACGCLYAPSDEEGVITIEACGEHDLLSVEAGLSR